MAQRELMDAAQELPNLPSQTVSTTLQLPPRDPASPDTALAQGQVPSPAHRHLEKKLSTKGQKTVRHEIRKCVQTLDRLERLVGVRLLTGPLMAPSDHRWDEVDVEAGGAAGGGAARPKLLQFSFKRRMFGATVLIVLHCGIICAFVAQLYASPFPPISFAFVYSLFLVLGVWAEYSRLQQFESCVNLFEECAPLPPQRATPTSTAPAQRFFQRRLRPLRSWWRRQLGLDANGSCCTNGVGDYRAQIWRKSLESGLKSLGGYFFVLALNSALLFVFVMIPAAHKVRTHLPRPNHLRTHLSIRIGRLTTAPQLCRRHFPTARVRLGRSLWLASFCCYCLERRGLLR